MLIWTTKSWAQLPICGWINSSQIHLLWTIGIPYWSIVRRFDHIGTAIFRHFPLFRIYVFMVGVSIWNFHNVIFLALIWAESCIFVSWGFKVSFCIFFNLFSNCMLSFWNFLITSTCDFLSYSDFLSCSLRYSLCLLIQRFFSYLSRSFPSMSSVDCSIFWLLFNFLICVTSVLLWFLNLKISQELLDNTLLTFVNSNLCVFLLSSYYC